jgi:hypothetical protein
MINKTKVYTTITLLGLLSRNACVGKNTGQMLAKGKEATNNGFKSLLLLAV